MKGLFQCPPWARSFCPFRACYLWSITILGYELLPFTFPLRAGDRWFRACCVIPSVQVELI